MGVPNATVEKLILESTFPGQPLAERPDSRSEGVLTDVSLRQGSVEHPERVDLAEIVDKSELCTRPLYIHFQLGPEREAVHALLDTDVREDRRHFFFYSFCCSRLDTAVNRWAATYEDALYCQRFFGVSRQVSASEFLNVS
jgi:hypothetical protein